MCLGVGVESTMHLGAGAVQRMRTFVPTRAYSDFGVDNVIKKKDEE